MKTQTHDPRPEVDTQPNSPGGQTGPEVSAERLLSKKELAPRLNVAVRTVDSWMQRGLLPYLKIGRSVRFRWSDVMEGLERFRVGAKKGGQQ